MADKEIGRTLRFPASLWGAIDRDAVRCGRSSVKQLEVLLSAYYGLRNVDLDYDRLEEMRPKESETVNIKKDSVGRMTKK